MSNQYLLHQMVLDKRRFFERIKCLYNGWKNSTYIVDCIMVAVGDDYRLAYSKSAALHIWLFGYELNDTVCVFTRDTVHILSGKNEIEFLKPLENRKDTDENEPGVKLFIYDVDDDKTVTNLLNIMASSHNSKPIGVFGKDSSPGQFCESWQTAMAAYNFQTTDIGPSVAYIMAVKDGYELFTIKEACRVSADLFEKYLNPKILEIIEAKKCVKHSRLAEGVVHALNDKMFISDVDRSQLELCYPPIIQSGAEYDLKFTAGSNDAYLDFGVIICSFGVRYKSYCSNISRTLLIKPSESIEENHNFLLNLEKQLLISLVPGARLNDIYQSALEYTKREKPNLVDHLTETFGSAIGIQSYESSLAIGPKCLAVVKKGMVFNVRIGLHHLIGNHHASDSNDDKSYALLHSNTVMVNEFGPAKSLTSPAYLKLIVDCWEHIFDYLSFSDAMSMARTCIRMQQMAGYYVSEYIPVEIFVCGKEIGVGVDVEKHNVPVHFLRFVKNMNIVCDLKSSLDAETFSSLKTVTLFELNEARFGNIQNVLKNIEIIWLGVNITDRAIEKLREYCPKLKSLHIDEECVFKRDHLFQQHFPSLQHLDFQYPNADIRIDGIKTFLECHKNLTHFECFDFILWSHKDLLQETNAHLDVLTIHTGRTTLIPTEARTIIQTDQFAKFLQRLFESRFFKKLHLFIYITIDFDFDALSTAISGWPPLENFVTCYLYSDLHLSCLVNLKELQFVRYSSGTLDKIAKSLLKLERLAFCPHSINDILPFIHHCKRLKTIKLWNHSFDDLKLISLNEERKKIDKNASQVLIYLREDIYLREKWNPKNVNLSHIKIARLDCGK